MKKKRGELAPEDVDRGMEEIERLYRRMIVSGEDPDGQEGWRIHPEVKSRLHKRILNDIESLRDAQRSRSLDSRDYREIDRRLRSRVLKEIQIIIDAYVLARDRDRIDEWQSMYGDIDHYIRDFFYFRMDQDYERRHKTLDDYKFVEE